MLDGTDPKTFFALRSLRNLVDKQEKPLIIWAGAGVSMWCGYPSWTETANRLLKTYRKFERTYDQGLGQVLLHEEKFPELFETFRVKNRQLYNRELAATFGSRATTPVYGRFLNIVKSIDPLRIVTTNVDETIERNLPLIDAVQSSDLGRCIALLSGGKSFVAKLHGSISSIESTVFTSSDYQRLVSDTRYVDILKTLLMQSVVVFIGYSLRDEYVLKLLLANCKAQELFGDGPHFLVHDNEPTTLPSSVQTIRYFPEPHADHRSAIMVLDKNLLMGRRFGTYRNQCHRLT